ncbi:hypothetical protein [Gaetbulibacter saemankumensis]|uniref:hypothetical protein n=1 Tax=Gaetbulibacter saemankumensis TaxID=311208 RepID=UPI0004204DE5|nr:hypothetical protein [Gaetbulibacter saemankumensis]
MNRILFLVLILITIVSCKTEKKEVPTTVEPEVIENADLRKYPKAGPYSSQMNIIYDQGYLFDEKIQLDEISVENIGENLYDVVLYFNESTDFDLLEKYKVSFILYPKNPDELTIEKDRKAKQKKAGTKAEIKMLDNSHVVVINSIQVKPKEFNKIKIHLYGNSTGTLNDNFLILRDIIFN